VALSAPTWRCKQYPVTIQSLIGRSNPSRPKFAIFFVSPDWLLGEFGKWFEACRCRARKPTRVQFSTSSPFSSPSLQQPAAHLQAWPRNYLCSRLSTADSEPDLVVRDNRLQGHPQLTSKWASHDSTLFWPHSQQPRKHTHNLQTGEHLLRVNLTEISVTRKLTACMPQHTLTSRTGGLLTTSHRLMTPPDWHSTPSADIPSLLERTDSPLSCYPSARRCLPSISWT